MRVSVMPRTANSLQQFQQRAGAVADDGHQRGLVVAGRRGQRPGRLHQHEPGDGAGAVGDVVDEHGQPVPLGRRSARRRRRRTCPSATASAAPAVEVAGSGRRPGRFAPASRRDCARACGWLATGPDVGGSVPGRAARSNATVRNTSRVITSGSPSASPSMVAGTEPSTEFSSGTSAASASPDRTAASAAGHARLGRPGSLRGGNGAAERSFGEGTLGPEIGEPRRRVWRRSGHPTRVVRAGGEQAPDPGEAASLPAASGPRRPADPRVEGDA